MLKSAGGFELWDLSGKLSQKLIGVTNSFHGAGLVGMQTSADLICGRSVLIISDNNQLHYWEYGTNQKVSVPFEWPIKQVRWLGTDGMIVVLNERNQLNFWNVDNHRHLGDIENPFGTLVDISIEDACVNGDNGGLLVWHKGGDLRLYLMSLIEGTAKSLREASTGSRVWRAAFNRHCTFMGYHSYRSRAFGLFDLHHDRNSAQVKLEEAEHYGVAFVDGPEGFAVLGVSNQVYFLEMKQSLGELIKIAKDLIPACLTPKERRLLLLPVEPPRWCITGPNHELERDYTKWTPKYPYDSDPVFVRWRVEADEAMSLGAAAPEFPKSIEATR